MRKRNRHYNQYQAMKTSVIIGSIATLGIGGIASYYSKNPQSLLYALTATGLIGLNIHAWRKEIKKFLIKKHNISEKEANAISVKLTKNPKIKNFIESRNKENIRLLSITGKNIK